MPQCIGAIDGSHIPVSPLALCHTDYYNLALNLNTGSCGLQVLLLDIYTGWPGSVYDACVLAHPTFYRKANAGQLLSDTTKTINGVTY